MEKPDKIWDVVKARHASDNLARNGVIESVGNLHLPGIPGALLGSGSTRIMHRLVTFVDMGGNIYWSSDYRATCPDDATAARLRGAPAEWRSNLGYNSRFPVELESVPSRTRPYVYSKTIKSSLESGSVESRAWRLAARVAVSLDQPDLDASMCVDIARFRKEKLQ